MVGGCEAGAADGTRVTRRSLPGRPGCRMVLAPWASWAHPGGVWSTMRGQRVLCKWPCGSGGCCPPGMRRGDGTGRGGRAVPRSRGDVGTSGGVPKMGGVTGRATGNTPVRRPAGGGEGAEIPGAGDEPLFSPATLIHHYLGIFRILAKSKVGRGGGGL